MNSSMTEPVTKPGSEKILRTEMGGLHSLEEHKKYLDEIIIKRRKQMEKRRYSSIQSGIYAGDELVTFAETELFGGSVKLFLPETFTDMPEEIRRVKYSCKNSPPLNWHGFCRI